MPRVPTRALQFANDPSKAWEITRASQGEPPQLWNDVTFTGAASKPAGAVRFVVISDTHSYEDKQMSMKTALEAIPDGDVLLHCGDFTNVGKLGEVSSFARWFGSLPHKRKVLIAGNHDLSMDPSSFAHTAPRFGYGQENANAANGICEQARAIVDAIPNCEYLTDSGTDVQGIRIWGSPWQPEFCEWAFNLPRGEQCREKWRLIPADADVLLTHGPPLGHGDLCSSGVRAGCVDLLDEVQPPVISPGGLPEFPC